MSNMVAASPNGRVLKTVGNAVSALSALARSGPLSLAQLARALGLGKSTVHLLLQTLLREGMVEYDQQTQTYRVGLRAFEIGAVAVEQRGFGIRLVPPMERLARQSNESVSLGVLSAGSVIFVQRIESPEILRADIRPGTRMPLHASASGKVLLSGLSDDEISALFPEETLPPCASRTLRTRPQLLTAVQQTRELGYAVNVDEFVSGIAAVAAPVRGPSGRIVASLSIAGPTVRFDAARWVEPLLATAAELSQLTGFRSSRPTGETGGVSASDRTGFIDSRS